jgi:DNA-directed RNA polymerase subunit M/transcription elongation factor TFIIS
MFIDRMSLLKHMCPICENYMPLNMGEILSRVCRNCGHKQEEQKGLVMETIIQEKASEGYRVFLNEFTREDPRLPHLKTIPCPNKESCPTRTGGEETDTIYIKYDPVNMKYLYICNVCKNHWRSR